MMQYLNWWGQHPWLGTFLIVMIVAIIGELMMVLHRKK